MLWSLAWFFSPALKYTNQKSNWTNIEIINLNNYINYIYTVTKNNTTITGQQKTDISTTITAIETLVKGNNKNTTNKLLKKSFAGDLEITKMNALLGVLTNFKATNSLSYSTGILDLNTKLFDIINILNAEKKNRKI